MTNSEPMGIALIGAGNISTTYLQNLTSFPDIRVVAVGDLVPDVARAQAAAHNVPNWGDVASVLDNNDVELVVNLTIPAAHAAVASQALAAGKHVWNEKPLATNRTDGQALLAQAEAANLRLGCAPDTFLGQGLQTVRRLVERGEIGTPLSALVLYQDPGPEIWHPNPAFLFGRGAGPLLDMAPYYLTALVQMLGPIASVAAVGSKGCARRVVVSGPKGGEEFDVMVPTHVGATIQFESGQSAQSIFSFDSAVPRTQIELTGTEATMLLPDPNNFDGDINIRSWRDADWQQVASTTALSARGTGILDIARAVREGRPHRAHGALAYHVLDTMLAIGESIDNRQFVDVTSTVDVPALLPADWDPRASTI